MYNTDSEGIVRRCSGVGIKVPRGQEADNGAVRLKPSRTTVKGQLSKYKVTYGAASEERARKTLQGANC